MTFYLAVNRSKDPELAFTGALSAHIREQGGSTVLLESGKDAYGNYHFFFPPDADGVALVLGGDGTLLQCVGDLNLSGLRCPVLGVHLGTLGFLTQVERDEAFDAVDQVLSGNYFLEDYPLLSASLRNRRVDFCQQAFNDVVIGRQGFARVLPLRVSVDGVFAYQANCDGMVISTALGSTGYNISLGGPVVPPGTPVFLVTPIAPHLPGIRPIIVPDSAEITVELLGSKGGLQREGLITCDGRSNDIWLEAEDVVTVKKHPSGGRFLRLHGGRRDFFQVFREKLLSMK